MRFRSRSARKCAPGSRRSQDAVARIEASSHPAAPARARRDGRRHRRQRASGVRAARDRAPCRAHRHSHSPARRTASRAWRRRTRRSSCRGRCEARAVVLLKISNDLRWMNSGPLAGLAEISLPALQPGSSIMPGKVNPVIPEAVAMAATRGHGARRGGRHGGRIRQFPAERHAAADCRRAAREHRAARRLGESRSPSASIPGLTVNAARISESLARNPMLLTALAPRIGYDRAAAIAKRAAAESRPILDIAVEETGLPRDELARLLDPARLARGEGPGPVNAAAPLELHRLPTGAVAVAELRQPARAAPRRARSAAHRALRGRRSRPA